jgi:predicted RNA-binding Zn-ribbon protein involved in translation (DUF1610 family)
MTLITEYIKCGPNKLGHLVHFLCPKCGKSVAVSDRTHTIAEDGTVTPSMVCPHEGCCFHEFIRFGKRPTKEGEDCL